MSIKKIQKTINDGAGIRAKITETIGELKKRKTETEKELTNTENVLSVQLACQAIGEDSNPEALEQAMKEQEESIRRIEFTLKGLEVRNEQETHKLREANKQIQFLTAKEKYDSLIKEFEQFNHIEQLSGYREDTLLTQAQLCGEFENCKHYLSELRGRLETKTHQIRFGRN